MKLCVHFFAHGSYWKAGDDIPDDEVPDFVRKYAVGNSEAKIPAPPKMRTSSHAEASAQEPKQQKLRKRYVRRGVAWRRAKDVAVKVGEPVFVRHGPNHYEEIGKVSSDGNLPTAGL